MSLHYDDKGKFFTEYVSKNSVDAIVQTVYHRIHGCLHVRVGERVSDEINRSDRFLALTDATIYDLQGNVIQVCPFLSVNRDQIIWIYPEESEATPEGENGVMP